MKAGKPLFIDKPIAGSLADAIAIFEAAKRYRVPVFPVRRCGSPRRPKRFATARLARCKRVRR